MIEPDPAPERLTDFERAVCYYTLPTTISPVTTGLVLIYAIVLLEAIGALTYGLLADNTTYTLAGAWSFGIMIVFGLVVFTLRSLLSEVRRRRTLAIARAMPNSGEMDDSIPDPFARHTLLRIAISRENGPILCTDNDGKLHYTIEHESPGAWFTVKNTEGIEHLRINIRKSASSFSFLEDNTPSHADVYIGAELVGSIQRAFSLKVPVFAVTTIWPVQRKYALRGDGIYRDRRLVGRVFRIRRYVYLDIHEDQYCEAILALFIIHAC
jgi:hypothetical protein